MAKVIMDILFKLFIIASAGINKFSISGSHQEGNANDMYLCKYQHIENSTAIFLNSGQVPNNSVVTCKCHIVPNNDEQSVNIAFDVTDKDRGSLKYSKLEFKNVTIDSSFKLSTPIALDKQGFIVYTKFTKENIDTIRVLIKANHNVDVFCEEFTNNTTTLRPATEANMTAIRIPTPTETLFLNSSKRSTQTIDDQTTSSSVKTENFSDHIVETTTKPTYTQSSTETLSSRKTDLTTDPTTSVTESTASQATDTTSTQTDHTTVTHVQKTTSIPILETTTPDIADTDIHAYGSTPTYVENTSLVDQHGVTQSQSPLNPLMYIIPSVAAGVVIVVAVLILSTCIYVKRHTKSRSADLGQGHQINDHSHPMGRCVSTEQDGTLDDAHQMEEQNYVYIDIDDRDVLSAASQGESEYDTTLKHVHQEHNPASRSRNVYDHVVINTQFTPVITENIYNTASGGY